MSNLRSFSFSVVLVLLLLPWLATAETPVTSELKSKILARIKKNKEVNDVPGAKISVEVEADGEDQDACNVIIQSNTFIRPKTVIKLGDVAPTDMDRHVDKVEKIVTHETKIFKNKINGKFGSEVGHSTKNGHNFVRIWWEGPAAFQSPYLDGSSRWLVSEFEIAGAAANQLSSEIGSVLQGKLAIYALYHTPDEMGLIRNLSGWIDFKVGVISAVLRSRHPRDGDSDVVGRLAIDFFTLGTGGKWPNYSGLAAWFGVDLGLGAILLDHLYDSVEITLKVDARVGLIIADKVVAYTGRKLRLGGNQDIEIDEGYHYKTLGVDVRFNYRNSINFEWSRPAESDRQILNRSLDEVIGRGDTFTFQYEHRW